MAARDLLSKDEINTLLEGVAEGRVPAAAAAPLRGEVRPFDFSGREARVPPVPQLVGALERLGANLGEPLSLIFGCAVACSSGPTRVVRLAEYLSALSLPASVNLVRLKPLEQSCLITCESAFISVAVNRFFGGDARLHSALARESVTPIEQHLMERVIRALLAELKDAAAPALALEPEFQRPLEDLRAIPGLDAGEALLVAPLEVRIEEQPGQVHFAFPGRLLEALRERLQGSAGGASEPASAATWSARLRQALDAVALGASCTLLETQLSLRSVMNLRAGDVIPVSLPSRVLLRVEGKPVYSGQYGASRGAHAVKTLQPVKGNA